MARGDVLLVGLPDSDKREEKGNRPAIVVQTEVAASPMLMVVPITSALGALRFSFTTRCATLFLKPLISCGVGILPAQIRTGKMPIPQDFQIKLHIAFYSESLPYGFSKNP